jgi:hypothetical protein
MGRPKISQKSRIRAELQKEIGSRCPICGSEDVGHFEIHHIDGVNSNNIIQNLLLLCQPCHSKFTKDEWPLSKGLDKKKELLNDINYLFYQSKPVDNFDYVCYNMQANNGRMPEENENGSVANIKVIDRYHFQIMLKQQDGRKWKGELILKNNTYGEMLLSYIGDNEFEPTRKECYLKQSKTGGFREDTFFLKPLVDRKDYGNELFKRRILET